LDDVWDLNDKSTKRVFQVELRKVVWCKSLCDGGLDAISTLIKAAIRPWSRASKLRLLDVSHDGAGPSAASIVAQTDAAMNDQALYEGGALLLTDTTPAFSHQVREDVLTLVYHSAQP
jgi:hypothetical protein